MALNPAVEICLALGANLGDREQNLQFALRRLAEKITIKKVSRWYKTSPVTTTFRDAPFFLNGALLAETALSPADLLALALAVESAAGRIRPSPPDAPRPLDIDVIFYGATILDLPNLKIPHPRFAARLFVLEPLNEIAPAWQCPRSRQTVAELCARTRQTNWRLDPPEKVEPYAFPRGDF